MRLAKRVVCGVVALGSVIGCTVKLPDYTLPNLGAIDGGTVASNATRDAGTRDSGANGQTSSGGGDMKDDAGGPLVGDAGDDLGPPAVRFIGRFDTSDPGGPKMAWPGTKVLARFDGTSASATLTQTNGFAGGPSYFDVVVDGAVQSAPLVVSGNSQSFNVAANLSPGAHTIELLKRTEANLGVVRFEGFTFTGGSGLLPPPRANKHLIEVIGDSAIDGFGVLGDRTTCSGGDPPETNDARQSFGQAAADALGADLMLSAYSGKGIQVNETEADNDVFPKIWTRTLPESGSSMWDFSKIPDAVVIELGGVDMDGLSSPPGGFQGAYDDFVGKVRARYPNAYVWLIVWSQIKETPVGERTAMKGVLDAIVAGRKNAGDARIFSFVLPEADYMNDETGCEAHANAAHEQAMGALMASEIKQRAGW
jgi:hypothetical protein